MLAFEGEEEKKGGDTKKKSIAKGKKMARDTAQTALKSSVNKANLEP